MEPSICKKCILPSNYPGVEIDKEGICNYCKGSVEMPVDPRKSKMENDRQKNIDNLKKTIEQVKKREDLQYHAVVALSGGKDSTYLYYLLTKEYGLRVKPVSINLNFESVQGSQNLKNTMKVLGGDLELIEFPEEFTNKFYRTAFEITKEGLGYKESICFYCHPLIIMSVVNYAYTKGIPLVFIGESPDESGTFIYEVPDEIIYSDLTPPFVKNSDQFTETEKKYFWNGLTKDKSKMPRILAPLHALPYNADIIRKKLEEVGLIEYNKSNPAITNCQILNFMLAYAMKNNRPIPYVMHISHQVREGMLSRDKALEMYEMGKALSFSIAKRVMKKINVKMEI